MRGCFPAPAVISGAASSGISQIVWGPLFQFSVWTSTSTPTRTSTSFSLIYNHNNQPKRRRWLPLSERSKLKGESSVALQLQCDCESEIREDNEWVVVNFYQFVFIKDAEAQVAKHHTFLKGLDIRGRIYVNEQGINAQVGIVFLSLSGSLYSVISIKL